MIIHDVLDVIDPLSTYHSQLRITLVILINIYVAFSSSLDGIGSVMMLISLGKKWLKNVLGFFVVVLE